MCWLLHVDRLTAGSRQRTKHEQQSEGLVMKTEMRQLMSAAAHLHRPQRASGVLGSEVASPLCAARAAHVPTHCQQACWAAPRDCQTCEPTVSHQSSKGAWMLRA